MSIRNISIYLLRTSRSNYDWKFASLYRLTSRRGYSTSADNSVETQANNIKTHDSANETITKTNESPSVNIRKSNSFANRRRPNREVNGINPSQTVKQTVPLPSSLLRTWEKSEEMLHLNFLNTDPYIRSYQNTYITKLPLTVTRRDIEMLTKGIFPDHEKIINKIFIVYNNYYKPTGSAWIQFNDSRNAVRFVKYANHKTFYGNKLNIELMRYIPEETQMDPLNFRADKCIVLTGLPRDITKPFLEEFIKNHATEKNLNLVDVTSSNTTYSKWLILLNNVEDTYFVFSRLHNKFIDKNFQIKARVIK